MKKVHGTVFAATVLAAAASFGNYVISSKSSGPYNLADVNFWGGAYPTEKIQFDGSRGPFRALSNVTLPALYNNWGTTVIDIDPDHPGVITLNGNLGTCTGSYQLNGCIIDFQGSYGFNTNEGWNDWVMRGSSMDLNACILTNMNMVICCNGGHSGNLVPKWTMRNNARIYCSGRFDVAYYGVPASGLTFAMESGAQVDTGYFETDGGSNGSGTAPHYLTMTGEGTKLTSHGRNSNGTSTANRIGFGYANAAVTVSDHAELDFTNGGTTYIGENANSVSNRLTVTGSARASFTVLYVGSYRGGGCNTIEVLDEASLFVTNLHLNGGARSTHDNTLVVSNASVEAMTFYNLNDHGSNSTIRIQGDHPQIVAWGPFGNAIESYNGTTYAFDIPPDGYAAGIVPIRVTGQRIVNGNTAGISFYGDDLLRFRFTGIEAFQRQQTRKRIARTRIPLVTATGGIVLTQAVLDDAAAHLPEGCSIYVKNIDGLSTLLLEVRVPLGTVFVVR